MRLLSFIRHTDGWSQNFMGHECCVPNLSKNLSIYTVASTGIATNSRGRQEHFFVVLTNSSDGVLIPRDEAATRLIAS